MKNWLIIFLYIVFAELPVVAQDTATLASARAALKQHKEPWLNALKIRQSFEDDESMQNPAILSVTLPKEGNNSYLVDLGLGYTLPRKDPKGLKTGFIVAEYHRTNLTDAEVNNFQLGYRHQWIFREPTISGLPGNNHYAPLYSTLRLNSTLKYRRDKVEGSHGAAATFMLAYFRQGSDYKTWFSSTKFSPSGRFHYTLSPQAGIEVQENFHAENTLYEGFSGRPVGRVVFGFGQSKPDPSDPFSPDAIWTLNIDAAARYDLVGKKYTDDDFHPLLKASLDFFILYKPVKLILGGTYVYGDNPIQGFRQFNFKSQHYALIAFKIQK